jgi:hypothetical protein
MFALRLYLPVMDVRAPSPFRDPRTRAVAAVAALVAGFGTWWLTAPPGALGLQPDSFAYLSGGWFLAHGEGLRVPLQSWASADTTRLWVWEPPGFSAAIAGGVRTGLSAIDATRVVQVLSAAVTAFFAAGTAALLPGAVGGTAAAVLASLLLLCSPFFWELHIQALSEPLFLAFFALWAYRSVRTRDGDWRLATVLAALPVVRWIGLGIIPATAWNAWRGRTTLRVVLPAVFVVVLWLLFLPAALAGRAQHLHWIGENLAHMPRDLAITLIHVAVPVRIPARSFFGVVAWLLVALLWWRVLRVDPDGTRWRFTRLAIGAAGLALILIPTSLLLDASVRFDEQRHVVPGLLLAMVGIAGAIALAWQRTGEWMRRTFIACAVVWSGAGMYATAELARDVRRAPLFLAGPQWRDAEVVRWVRAQGSGSSAHSLYTNQPWALWFHAHRVARIVCADAVDRTLHTGCPVESVDPVALRETLARRDGYLVDVTVPWPGVLSVEPLAQRAGLVLVARFPDGSVWRAP